MGGGGHWLSMFRVSKDVERPLRRDISLHPTRTIIHTRTWSETNDTTSPLTARRDTLVDWSTGRLADGCPEVDDI